MNRLEIIMYSIITIRLKIGPVLEGCITSCEHRANSELG